jgi:N-dimethylarginine dimethylaminohydrolase
MEKMVKQVQNPMHVYRQKKREMKAIRQHNEHFFRILKTIGVTVALWRVLAETKDFSERGFEKGFSVSRKVEKELLASAIASAAMMRALTKEDRWTRLGYRNSWQRARRASIKG